MCFNTKKNLTHPTHFSRPPKYACLLSMVVWYTIGTSIETRFQNVKTKFTCPTHFTSYFMEGVVPTTSWKFAHSPLPGKIPPSRLPAPTKFLFPPTKGSFSSPPLNNNFLNGQNHSSSDSHNSIKKFPSKIYHPTALDKRIFPLPLNAIWKTLPTKFSVP